MSTVTLTIGPKSYAVACADGEEPHIAALGAMIAEKYAQLGASRAPLEAQNMLFAALFMADELAEARKQLAACPPDKIAGLETQIAGLETQVAELQTAKTGADTHISDLQQKLDDALAAAAQAELQAAEHAEAQAAEQAAAQSAAAETANAMVTRLELLATRAEATADALEAGADNA